MQDIIQQLLNQFGLVFGNIFGSPILMGLFMMIVFAAVIVSAKIRDDGRIMLLIPAAILASAAFLPGWVFNFVGMVGIGIILFYGLYRLVSR